MTVNGETLAERRARLLKTEFLFSLEKKLKLLKEGVQTPEEQAQFIEAMVEERRFVRDNFPLTAELVLDLLTWIMRLEFRYKILLAKNSDLLLAELGEEDAALARIFATSFDLFEEFEVFGHIRERYPQIWQYWERALALHPETFAQAEAQEREERGN